MNFLAHLYLSGDNPKRMVGNFIGDFVKGKHLAEKFEPEIVNGIELHRAIDSFTDSHPVVLRSKIRLRGKYRHYAPVIVDVFYDHFLAKFWDDYYTALPLERYARHAYTTLETFHSILPEDVKYLLPHMISGNWLVNYASTEGIRRALAGMSRRSRFDPKMDESIDDLQSSYEDFRSEFVEFFPELERFAADYFITRS